MSGEITEGMGVLFACDVARVYHWEFAPEAPPQYYLRIAGKEVVAVTEQFVSIDELRDVLLHARGVELHRARSQNRFTWRIDALLAKLDALA